MLTRLSLALVGAAVLAPSALAANPDIHAHRGGTVVNGTPRFGEESIRAYRNAALHGFVFEVDAKLTENGVPVAIHDATLDRTTNCSGQVRARTLAELASCRTDVLGSPGSPLRTRGARHTEPIATIAEVLKLAKQTGVGVNLEIKNIPTDVDYDATPAFANRPAARRPTGPVPAVTTARPPEPAVLSSLVTAATAVVFDPFESSITETVKGPKNAFRTAFSSRSPALMSVPPMKMAVL